MATPRKHWFKVADQILREPWDNDTLACAVRLMAWLNQRWARDRPGDAERARAVISQTDIMAISGKRRADVALKSLQRLADVVSISVERRGDVVSISWPKYAKFQSSESESREVRARELPAPTPTPTPTPTPSSDPLTPVASAPELALNGTHRNDLRAAVRSVWPQCQQAAQRHGRRWTALSEARLASMAARLREFGPDPAVLVRAIDGAVAYWRLSAPKERDPTRHLVPETVYRASTFPKYIETMEDPKVAPKKYWSQMTDEEQIELQRQAGMIS